MDEIFHLNDGRPFAMMELIQSYTYEGFSDGFPTRDFNSKYLGQLILSHATNIELQLLSPSITVADIPGKGDCEMLPEVTCIGRFCMYKRMNDKIMAKSTLKIIWLQNRFAFPIDLTIREQIGEIEWDKLTEWTCI